MKLPLCYFILHISLRDLTLSSIIIMDSSFLPILHICFFVAAAAIGFVTLLKKFSFHQDNKDVDSSSPSSVTPSSSCVAVTPLSNNCTHQVFPSFHGADVRRAFLSHFLKEFRRKGIEPFIDNDIERSKSIGPELIEAIRGSRIAIILLSRNYASSSWCLNELAEIMKCREKLGQIVMTIFYEVDPTDVKKQKGDFGKVFEKTCKYKTKEDIGRWRHALAEVAEIAGYHSSNWDSEAAMVERITSDISNKLNNFIPSNDFEDLIGMKAHMEKMGPLLCLDSDEVRMIGIWGPSGIGKTTIARFLFKQHSHSFHLSVFMDNIMCTIPARSDEYSTKYQLHQLLMSRIFNQKDIEIPNLGVAEDRLQNKRVLVVLDDVYRSVILDAMAKETRWFGPGSRIIITTQDKRLLRAHGIEHIYNVHFPAFDEALQIFCMNAFGQNFPKDGFEELSREVTRLAGQLPLGLKIMGSYLRNMSKQEWRNELPSLRYHLDGEIESILKFSYDALKGEEKDLFLFIACLFNDERIKEVEGLLIKRFRDVRRQLCVLIDKSLIYVSDRMINMHDLLEQLGREIVRKQSIHEPGERQFLVDAREICEVLTHATGSRSVIGINLNFFQLDEQLIITEKAFEGMCNLQFLKFRGCYFDRDRLKYLSQNLRLLDWTNFPMTCLPSKFQTDFLVKIDMRSSKLEKLWEGIQTLRNLKWMNLSFSKNLKELPDLSTAANLEILNLSNCLSLVELPSSIGNAVNLQKLDLDGCSSLLELPSSIGNAANLRELDLDGCSSLVELPSSIGNAANLQKLYLRGCSGLVELPSSIGNAANLQILNLDDCSSLVELPSSIGNAANLQILNLGGCSSLVELPSSIGNAANLQNLYLCRCSSLVALPSSIGNAANLQNLDLSNCSSLVELPSSIGKAANLQKLYLTNCSSLVELPSSIENAPNLQKLYLGGCSSLVELPPSIRNVVYLQKLYIGGYSSLVELLSSTGNVANLQKLYLDDCSSLVELPSSIGNVVNL